MPWRTTLNSTVKVTVAIAVARWDPVRPSSSTASRANTTEARPSRPEPADEHDARSIESRPDQAQHDREHAHDREAREGVHDHCAVEVVERYRDEGGTEDEPHDEREELATELGELDRLLKVDDLVVDSRSEGDAGDERGDESVRVD